MDNLSATGTSLSDEVFGYVPPSFLAEHGLVKEEQKRACNKLMQYDKTDLNVAYDFIDIDDTNP